MIFKRKRPEPAAPEPRVKGSRRTSQVLNNSQYRTWPQHHSPMTTAPATNTWFQYTGLNRASYYRYLRDHIPIVSAAVWTWVHLCSTQQSYDLEGSESEIRDGRRILDDLERRIGVNPLMRGKGIARLTESMFLELFTVGRFAGEIVLNKDGDGIDFFRPVDPDRIDWEFTDQWQPTFRDENDDPVPVKRERLFYATLHHDLFNPRGPDPLAAIPFVTEIEQRMVDDMARSSHNAGTPRMQIRITPPEQLENEGSVQYIKRINQYFDDVVSQMKDIGPDDNIFTWSDVEVRVVGGDAGKSYAWRLNREQVIEDVITGLKLYPWALGRSHGTTRNWVHAQYNMLMQIVDSIQSWGTSLADWIRTTELRLKGNLAVPHHRFAPNQDPFLVERERAKQIQFEVVDSKVQRGYISKDQGARELGYTGAYAKDD
jgi:hypothetical protein